MSRLYELYLSLKKSNQNSNTLFLFKSGVFFIFINEDAKIASKLFNLKITNLTEDIIKCGFPVNSLEKYSNLAKLHSYELKIIDTKNTIYTLNNYTISTDIACILEDIKKININTISVSEIYNFVEDLQNKVNKII